MKLKKFAQQIQELAEKLPDDTVVYSSSDAEGNSISAIAEIDLTKAVIDDYQCEPIHLDERENFDDLEHVVIIYPI